MNTIAGVIVGHAHLAAALIAAVEQIAGVEHGLAAVSNSGCDRVALEERLMAAVRGHPTIVFVDMPSGSCLFAAMQRLKDAPNIRIVTGVNLAMLLEFVFQRDGDLDEVVATVVEAGMRAVGQR